MHTILSTRYGIMDISESYFTSSFVLVVPPKRKGSPKLTAPFSSSIWMANILTLLGIACIGKLLNSSSFLGFFGTFLGNGNTKPPSRGISRYILGLWLIFSFFLVNCYVVTYFRFLTEQGQTTIADTVDEMIKRDYTIYIRNFTQFWKDYPNIKVAFPTIPEALRMYENVSSDGDFKGAVMSHLAYVGYWNKINPLRPLIPARQRLLDQQVCIYYPVGSALRVHINPMLSSLRAAGIFAHWTKELTADENLGRKVSGTRNIGSLKLAHFNEIFVALIVGYLTAVVVFAMEMLSRKVKSLQKLF